MLLLSFIAFVKAIHFSEIEGLSRACSMNPVGLFSIGWLYCVLFGVRQDDGWSVEFYKIKIHWMIEYVECVCSCPLDCNRKSYPFPTVAAYIYILWMLISRSSFYSWETVTQTGSYSYCNLSYCRKSTSPTNYGWETYLMASNLYGRCYYY